MLMIRVFRFIAIMLLIFAFVNYLAYLKTGRFWLPAIPSSMSWPNLPFSDTSPDRIPVTAPAEPAYKWRENGRWHYGDHPPAGVNAVKLSKDEE